MESRWQRSLIPSLLVATILGIGATVVWALLLFTAIAFLGQSQHPLAPQVGLTVALLSPALLSAAPLYFQDFTSLSVLQFLKVVLDNFWFSFLVLGIVSLPLSMLCYFHHRRYGQRTAIAWAIYVMVMGAPGAIGYWLHRRWPATVRCDRCDMNAPCDRETCLYCGAAFPIPSATGAEIMRPYYAASDV